jgi:hypothetical protein
MTAIKESMRELSIQLSLLNHLYAGMNASMDQLLAGYTPDELDLLASFLRRTTDAGRAATGDLANR